MPRPFARPDPGSDEGGLWAMMDREERKLRRSPFRIRDAELDLYLKDLACRLGGEHCTGIRVYAMRTPYFNASMAPNGMMQVWSGLLLRVENEAQLAAVIGHELGHFLQRHSLERLRDLKAQAAFAQFVSLFGLGAALVGGLAAAAAAMAFTRDQEREADRIGHALMTRHGYDPHQAARIWGLLLDERAASPDAEDDAGAAIFASHPAMDERRDELARLAGEQRGELGRERLQARLAPLRTQLLRDELKRGKPHGTVALLGRMLQADPADAELLHFRGEALRQRALEGDEQRALADFEAAVSTGREPAATHRSLGELHRALGRPQDARAAWQRFLERAPDAPDAALIRQSLTQE